MHRQNRLSLMLFLVTMTKYTVCACVAHIMTQQFLLYYKYLLLLQCLQSLILRRLPRGGLTQEISRQGSLSLDRDAPLIEIYY